MDDFAFELFDSGEARNVWVCMVARTDHNAIKRLRRDGTVCFGPHLDVPSPRTFVISGLLNLLDGCAELYKPIQIKIGGVHFEVLEDGFMRHERRKVCGRWKVAEGHHLFTRVDSTGVVHASLPQLDILAVVPQTTDIVFSFEADWLESLVQTAFHGYQATAAGADDSNAFHAGDRLR